MGLLRPWTGRAVATVVILAAASAQAQESDPTGRHDIADALHRYGHDVENLPTPEAAEGRPVTFNLSLTGTYTTNAGPSRLHEADTGFVSPAFSIGVTPVSVGGWAVGGGARIDGDYYSGDYDSRFGEGRAEGFGFAEHSLGPGTLTAEVVLLGFFENDFSNQFFRLLISNVNYSISRGPVSASFAVEYEDSDVPEERRTRLKSTLGYTLPEPQFGYTMRVQGNVAFSDFNGGANSARNDVVAALVLTAERRFARGWSLEWEAGFINRFSNRERSRFTALDLSVGLAKRF